MIDTHALGPDESARASQLYASTVSHPAIDQAVTADDLLTALYAIPVDRRSQALAGRGVKILREAADLVGVGDADTLTKRQAIAAIIENF